MKRARLPLTALRSFEAAGRHENFSKAAAELHVSQAAISRQVRELESQLKLTLFDRYAQGVKLTAVGAALLEELTQAFDKMELALAGSSQNYRRTTLALTVEAGFASCWLLPRLDRFYAQYPDIQIDLDTDERLTEFRPHEPQLAIRFSAAQTQWQNAEARQLLGVVMVPVWSPNLQIASSNVSRPGDLLKLPLLHEIGARDWKYWSAQMGIDYSDPDHGPRYDNQMLLIQAALNGQGVALVDQVYANPHLHSGALVTAFESVVGPGAYWIVTPTFSGLSWAGQKFVEWLEGELKTSDKRPQQDASLNSAV